MKRVIVVSPYYLPSNLAGVHRTRIMANGLRMYGWEPIVVTVHERHYESHVDKSLLALADAHVRIERVDAWSSKVCRPLGFGDLAIRAQCALRRRVRELIESGEGDLVFVSVLPGLAGLVGAWAKRRFDIPFVLDYQDPWFSDWGASQPAWSKSGLAHRMAGLFEPRVVRVADALTAVSTSTLQTLFDRGLVPAGTPTAEIPIGVDCRDHAVARLFGCSVIDGAESRIKLAYVGSLTDRMLPAMGALFGAVRQLRGACCEKGIRLHLVGVGDPAGAAAPKGLHALAADLGVDDLVRVEPDRIGFLDALRTMQDADVLLLVGSTDAHYTASKLFPYWLSGKPVVGLFHSESTVNQLARKLGGVRLVNYDGISGPETREQDLADALIGVVGSQSRALPLRDEGAIDAFTSQGVAAAFAAVFDRVMLARGLAC